MGKFTPSIIVYVISGLIYIISSLLNLDYIAFVSKPLFGVSIILHYWIEAKDKFNLYFFIVLLLYFSADVFNLFEGYFNYVLLLNMLVYAMLSYTVVKKILGFRNKVVDNLNLTYILLSVVYVVCLVYISVFLVFDKDFEYYHCIVFYSFILSFLAITSTILYSFSNEKEIVYLMFATYCYLISDVFYIIYYYSYDLVFFKGLNMLCGMLSYYFIVNYFLNSKSSKDVNDLNG